MKKWLSGLTSTIVMMFVTVNVAAYDFDVVEEVDYPGPIIRVVEWGDDNRIGVWVYLEETLAIYDDKGEIIAACDTIIPAEDIFGDFGGTSVNIDGTKVQYAGFDGIGLAGTSIDCLTGEIEIIGSYIPTFNQPDGNYTVGYSGQGTSIFFPDGTENFLHFLEERIFYYSGNDDGSLLAGISVLSGGTLPYVSDRGPVGVENGVAVVRVTPFGDTVVVGTLTEDGIISQQYIVPADNTSEIVDPNFIIADANPDGFIFNRFEAGDGTYGPDLFGSDCYLIDEKEEIALLSSTIPSEGLFDENGNRTNVDGGESELTLVYDKWCQSFVRQNRTIYVAVGDSWMSSMKMLKLELLAEVTENVTSSGSCTDVPPLGDGWGWDGVESCRIDASSGTASQVIDQDGCFDSPPLGDGWGWDGVQTCELVANDDAVFVANSGTCFDSPPLGNGQGWDGVNSCQIDLSANSTEVLVAGDCYDHPPLGDGYGWNGQSCFVNEENGTLVVVASDGDCVDAPPLGNGWGNNENGTCRITINNGALVAADGDCVDVVPFGDGWGHNGTETCLIATGQVVSADGGCVDTAPFGDGWGWDGTDSCRVAGTVLDSDRNGCIDTSPTGDGWGWNGTESCKIIY